MNTLSYKTQSAKPSDIQHDWYVIDAEGKPLGRLASAIAHVLRGKNKPSYTPHMDTGDYVIVLNAGKITLSGNKMSSKEYLRFSGYPGGLKRSTAAEVLDRKPTFPVENAVRGMLPKNSLGRQMIKKLFVYEGDQHPHVAQQPKDLNI